MEHITCKRCENSEAIEEIGQEGMWTVYLCPCCGYHFLIAERTFNSVEELYHEIGMSSGSAGTAVPQQIMEVNERRIER